MFIDSLSKSFFVKGFLVFIFDILKKKATFRKQLRHLAETHYQRGVKAVEYSIIGEVITK